MDTSAHNSSHLPARRLTRTWAVVICQQDWRVSASFDREGRAREVFATPGEASGMKPDSAMAELASDLCILVSKLLQAGVDLTPEILSPLAPDGFARGLLTTLRGIEEEAGQGVALMLRRLEETRP